MAESTKPKVVPREPTAFQNFIAGGVGGIVVVLIGHPFDTVKVRAVFVRVSGKCLYKCMYVSSYVAILNAAKNAGSQWNIR